MEPVLFWIYALFACGGALAVMFSQNVVRMAFYLVISLGSTSALFFLLDADFVGATQLLIYVGGTVVLLIFGVMLTASSPFSSIQNTPAEILQGGVVGLAFLTVVITTVLATDWTKVHNSLVHHAQGAHHADDSSAVSQQSEPAGFNPREEGNSTRSIGAALLGMRFDRDLEMTKSSVAANPHDHHHEGHAHDEEHAAAGHHHSKKQVEAPNLSAGYLLPFEIISVHLLVVLVGAAYLARAKRPAPV